MPDDEVQTTEAAADASPSPMAHLVPIGGSIVALVVGLAIGLWLVGPVAAERLASPGDQAAEHGSADHGGGHGAKGSGPSGKYRIENLVLNPAETKGTRFLMATVVVSLTGEGAEESLAERDAEIRDHLMSLLGSKTVDELTDVSRRGELKREIRVALSDLVPAEEIKAVYLPTFVIQ
jgi:flagellar FliL protein